MARAAPRPTARAACGPDLQPLPEDLVVDRRQFFSVGDVDRDGLHDLALFGHDAAGAPRAFVYYGQADRNLDLACWDHELPVSGFFRIGGIKIEPSWHGRDVEPGNPHGSLFVFGIDAADRARVRIEERWIAPSRAVEGPRTATGTLPLPAWDAGAASPAGFLVWRYVGESALEEVFFGGGDKVFTVPINENGLGLIVGAVANPNGVRVQQAVDVSADRLLIDDGTHVYSLGRDQVTDTLALPEPLDGPGAAGAADGDVFAAHDWTYENLTVRGLRVPRHRTAPAQTSLQLFNDNTVTDRPLRGVTPAGGTGPYLTDAVVSKNHDELGSVIAAVVTTFDACDAPASQFLAVQTFAPVDPDLAPMQSIPLAADVLPALTAGSFRAEDDRDLLVMYPRRAAGDPPTSSACFRALTASSVAPCAQVPTPD